MSSRYLLQNVVDDVSQLLEDLRLAFHVGGRDPVAHGDILIDDA